MTRNSRFCGPDDNPIRVPHKVLIDPPIVGFATCHIAPVALVFGILVVCWIIGVRF